MLIDPAGNWLRHLDATREFWNEGCTALDDGTRKKRRQRKKRSHERLACRGCGFVMDPENTACPRCGKERKRKRIYTETSAGETVQWSGVESLVDDFWGHVCYLGVDRYPDNPVLALRRARGIFRALTGRSPNWDLPLRPAHECHPEIELQARLSLAKWIARKRKKEEIEAASAARRRGRGR